MQMHKENSGKSNEEEFEKKEEINIVGTVVDTDVNYITFIPLDSNSNTEFLIPVDSPFSAMLDLDDNYTCTGCIHRKGGQQILMLSSARKADTEELAQHITHPQDLAKFSLGQGFCKLTSAAPTLAMMADARTPTKAQTIGLSLSPFTEEKENKKPDKNSGQDCNTQQSTDHENHPPSESKSVADVNNKKKATVSSAKLQVSAVVLTVDRATESALLFSPDPKLAQFPFFKVNKIGTSFETSVKSGAWFLVPIDTGAFASENNKPAAMEAPAFTCPVGEPAKPMTADQKPPMRTRVSNGAVQLFTKVTLLHRSEREGLLIFGGKLLGPHQQIVDSACLLNHLGDSLVQQKKIRNAPTTQIGIWCTLRKFPMGTCRWKVTAVGPKHRKKMEVAKDKENVELEEGELVDDMDDQFQFLAKGVKQTRTANKAGNRVKSRHADDAHQQRHRSMSSKRTSSQQQSKNVANGETPMEGDGLICSQSTTKYFVYVPKRCTIVQLDKQKCREYRGDILGMWIGFKTNLDKCTIVDEFWTIPPPILVIPTRDHVMLRSQIRVPHLLEQPTEKPFSLELRVNLMDPHKLLTPRHAGRTLSATIGCAAKWPPPVLPGESDEDLESSTEAGQIKWYILYVDMQE